MRTTIKKISTMLLAFVIVVTSMSTFGMENTYAASKKAATPGKIYGVTLSQKAISGSSQKNITVKWNKLSKNVKGYRIYRKTDSGRWKFVRYAGAKKYTKSSKTQSATFRVNAGHKYTFRVRGYNYKVYKKKVYRSYGSYSSTRATTVKKPVTNTNPSNPSDSGSSSGGSGGTTVSISTASVICKEYKYADGIYSCSYYDDNETIPVIDARVGDTLHLQLNKTVSGSKTWKIDGLADDRFGTDGNEDLSICSINSSTGVVTLKKNGHFYAYCQSGKKYSKLIRINIFPKTLNLQYKRCPSSVEGNSGVYLEGYPRRANSGWNESEWKRYVRDGDTLYIDPANEKMDTAIKIPGATSVTTSDSNYIIASNSPDNMCPDGRLMEIPSLKGSDSNCFMVTNSNISDDNNSDKVTVTVTFADNRKEKYNIIVKRLNGTYVDFMNYSNEINALAKQVENKSTLQQAEFFAKYISGNGFVYGTSNPNENNTIGRAYGNAGVWLDKCGTCGTGVSMLEDFMHLFDVQILDEYPIDRPNHVYAVLVINGIKYRIESTPAYEGNGVYIGGNKVNVDKL